VASNSLEPTGSSIFSIPEIVSLAREGTIRIPHFQRPFVWDASDVRELFDSIYRGFPIGTAILWRKDAPAEEVRFGPISFHADATDDALWVVDGQQRIISLFGSLAAGFKDVDPRFEVYFDFSIEKFINPRRGAVPPRAIPVREAIETRRLAAWTRLHSEDLEVGDFDVADRLVGVLRDYRISAYVVGKNDEKILREVFDRVNSAGKPITRAQVFQALFASDTEPGSPAVVVKELNRLGFGTLEENRIVQSLLALRGGNFQRDLHDEFAEGDDPSSWYDLTEQALTKAINFIRSEGVPHISLMPYTFPIPVLAAFFYLHPDPSPWVLRLLARWLWRSWINPEGSQTPTIRNAVMAVNPKKLDRGAAPSEYEAVRNLLEGVSDAEIKAVSMDGFRTDKAKGRLILLALASLGPLRPDGTKIDIAEEFEKHGLAAVTELVRNQTSKAAARSFCPTDSQRPTGKENAEVLASHVIDEVAASRLQARDTQGFLERRGELLAPLVRNFLNNHLERNSLVRPPLEDLIVVDEEDGE
jgi:Protein of unknown function DUF262